MEKEEVINTKVEQLSAANNIKNRQSTQFAGEDGKGVSVEGFPFIPVGSAIFLKWNMPGDLETRIIGVDYSDRKPLNNAWEVIGVGGKVLTVALNDKIILKAESDINSFDTRIKDHEMKDLIDIRYHIIYEFDIMAIVK